MVGLGLKEKLEAQPKNSLGLFETKDFPGSGEEEYGLGIMGRRGLILFPIDYSAASHTKGNICPIRKP